MKLQASSGQRRAIDRRRLSERDKAAIAEAFLSSRREAGAVSAADLDAAAAVRAADIPLSVAAGLDAVTLTEAIARVRRAKVSLALQTERPARKGQFSHEPTPERAAHAVHGIASEVVVPGSGPVPDTNRHRIVDFVARARKDLSEDEVAVLEWVIDLAEAHTLTNLTVNYAGSSGGGHPGRKMGGLGNVPQSVRDKHATFQMIERRLHPGFVKTLRDLVLQVRFDDKPVSAAEFAALLFPQHKDKSFRSGVALTAVKLLAWRLIEIQWRERALTRAPSVERRTVMVATEPKGTDA